MINRDVKRKILLAVCVMLIVAVAAVALVACGRDKKKQDDKLRHNSAIAIRDTALLRMNAEWTGELANEQLLAMSSAGEYVATYGWAALICDVLEKSTLQTAKLSALADAFKSEDATKLFDDFSANAELLLPLLRTVGFTQEDISELVYDLLEAIVKEGKSTLEGTYQRLQTLISSSPTSEAMSGLISARSSVSEAIDLLNSRLTEAKQQQMLEAFEESKEALNAFVAFAYNMLSSDVLSDELVGNILGGEDGALGSITDSEIAIIFSALLNNISRLKQSVEGDNLAKLSRTIDLVIGTFDADSIGSALYAEIVRYAKYANMIVAVVPTLCEVVGYAGEALQKDSFVADIRKTLAVNTSDETSGLYMVNLTILASRLISDIMSRYNAVTLGARFDEVRNACYSLGSFDMQKAVPVYLLDAALNLNVLLSSVDDENVELQAVHPSIWGEGESGFDELGKLGSLIMFESRIEAFKQAYYDYRMSARQPSDFDRLYEAARRCGFDTFGITNNYYANRYNCNEQFNSLGRTWADMWYNDYIERGYPLVLDQAEDLFDLANRDVKLFIEDYYNENHLKIEEFGAKQIYESIAEADEEALIEELRSSGLMGITFIIVLAFSQIG